MALSADDIAQNWMRWGLRGQDGFASHLLNHVKVYRLDGVQREMIRHVIARLEQALTDDLTVKGPADNAP